MQIAIAVTAVVLAAGGAGVAQAVSGSEEEGGREANEKADGGNLSGDAKGRAERAAVSAAGGGTVVESEKGDDGSAAYEVAVKKADGSTVEYHLDGNFKVIGTERD